MRIKEWHKKFWYWLCKHLLIALPSHVFYKAVFFVNCKRLGFRWYNFDSKKPETLNEKINFLKLYDRPALGQIMADKVAVRTYVEKAIGTEYLIPVIDVYNSCTEIDFEKLPEQFALKTNHGSGWNLICKDKKQINWATEQRKMDRWLQMNAYYLGREWQYRGIRPLLICEEMLEYEIKDFKLFCFHGVAEFIQVDMNRYTEKGHTRDIFDRDWNSTNIQLNYPKSGVAIDRPENLSEMLILAEKLAEPLIFCRIDLYEHGGNIYFGEVTLYPGSGVEPFADIEQDRYLGSFLDLNRMSANK